MSAIERLKRARNVEELAEQVEPLAQALAALTDETRQTLTELQQASLRERVRPIPTDGWQLTTNAW
jgi:prefoldin subunit 5